MRPFSYVLALVLLLSGPSLAGSADHDLPGIGTFSYNGPPVLRPAPARDGCDRRAGRWGELRSVRIMSAFLRLAPELRSSSGPRAAQDLPVGRIDLK